LIVFPDIVKDVCLERSEIRPGFFLVEKLAELTFKAKKTRTDLGGGRGGIQLDLKYNLDLAGLAKIPSNADPAGIFQRIPLQFFVTCGF